MAVMSDWPIKANLIVFKIGCFMLKKKTILITCWLPCLIYKFVLWIEHCWNGLIGLIFFFFAAILVLEELKIFFFSCTLYTWGKLIGWKVMITTSEIQTNLEYRCSVFFYVLYFFKKIMIFQNYFVLSIWWSVSAQHLLYCTIRSKSKLHHLL